MLLVPVTPGVGARPFSALKAHSTSAHKAACWALERPNCRTRPPEPRAPALPPLPKKKVCTSLSAMGGSNTPLAWGQALLALDRLLAVVITSAS
jgi:hypothetical protein